MTTSELDQVLAMVRAAPFTSDQPVATARAGMDSMGDAFPVPAGVTVETITLGGRPAERLTAEGQAGAGNGPVFLYLHGGGYVIGSPKSHRHLAAQLALETGGVVYVPDYRMAPEDPFPAAVDDGLAANAELVGRYDPRRLAVGGDSAGGGLAFATLLAARDKGLPMPGALVGISPWVNLGTENASYDRLAGVDPMLSRQVTAYFAPRYLGNTPVRDPAASPLFADLHGLPPTLIQIGDRECFFGDATDLHEVLLGAGVDSELVVWKQMFHVWHLYWPLLSEGRAAIAEIAAFVKGRCAA